MVNGQVSHGEFGVEGSDLCHVPVSGSLPSGLLGPANTDSGDAPHGAHCPAEPGSAAGGEAGQPGGK